MSTNLKGLHNFTKKIDKLINNENSIKNQIANQIADYGVELARRLILYKSFDIQKTRVNNGEIKVVAYDHSERKHIAYVEFGTGYEGKMSTYEGTLPTFWEYFYPSEHKNYELLKWNIGTKENPIYVGGQASQGNLWNVSMTLQKDLHDIKFYITY